MKRGRSKKKIINQPTGIKGIVFDDLYDDNDYDWKSNSPNMHTRNSKHLKNNWQSIRHRYLK
jgi:hypothetical protein